MAELVLCRGIPASGKSTWAKAWVLAGPNRVRVSRDDIRFAMFGRYTDVDEKLVTSVEDKMIAEALIAKKNVVVDDTNIDQKYVTRLAALGHRLGAHVSLHQFPIDLATAKRRNAARERVVPNNVMDSMYSRFMANQEVIIDGTGPDLYTPVEGTPKAIIVDIDGTIAERRVGPGQRSPFDWKRVGEDEVVREVAQLVDWYWLSHYKIIVMSGRDEVCREETEQWLDDNGFAYDVLYMRPENDWRKDSIVKQELFDKHVRFNYNVEVVLDDRQQVVDMWRSIGLRVFQVAPGDF